MVCWLAYLDPGSASLILQALLGGFAGIMVFGRYLWQRLSSRSKATIDKKRQDDEQK